MKRSEIIITVLTGLLFVCAIVCASLYIMNNTVIHNMGN
jgi:heme/copper-type cytochrome/quinol oxidase subunit 4